MAEFRPPNRLLGAPLPSHFSSLLFLIIFPLLFLLLLIIITGS